MNIMYVTASKDTREMLTGNWDQVEQLRRRYEDLMCRGVRNLSAREKKELESCRKDICLKEFDAVQSPNLRLSKFVHLGDNTKRYESDAVVAVCRKSRNQLDDLTQRFGSARAIPGEKRLSLKLAGRMIVNHTGGVLENAGLCLHPHAGIPFIPGSAVKGVARHAAWCRWANAVDTGNSEEADRLALMIAFTFGFPTNDTKLDQHCRQTWNPWFSERGQYETFAGLVSFMPAMPREYMELVTDIVNGHHRNYYAGKQTPLDIERPNPQFFPAVEQGAMFEFTVRPVRRAKWFSPEGASISLEEVVNFALQSVQDAARDFGFGSKTSNGYGWFAVDEEKQESLKQAADDLAREQQAQLEERKRKENLSPEEKAAEEYVDGIKGDVEGHVKGRMAKIKELDESEQRAICLLLKSRLLDQWKNDCREYAKAENQSEKKRLSNKSYKRVKAVRSVAQELGVELP
jgi:CRISPR type III-B/RAMP module RAMP protein Cmr6